MRYANSFAGQTQYRLSCDTYDLSAGATLSSATKHLHFTLVLKANKGKSRRNLPHIPTRLVVVIARYFLKIRQVVAKEKFQVFLP